MPGIIQLAGEVRNDGLRRSIVARHGMLQQRKLNTQIGEHLRQRIMQLARDGGALLHQQQLLIMFLRLIEIEPPAQHRRHAFHERQRNIPGRALPAQFAVQGVLH